MEPRSWASCVRVLGAVSALVIIACLLTFHVVGAQQSTDDLPYYWDAIDVEIAILDSGDLIVTETHRYVFNHDEAYETRLNSEFLFPRGGLETVARFNAYYRNPSLRMHSISLERADEIDSLGVSGDGVADSETRTTDDAVLLRWTHPLEVPQNSTFVLTYRVRGGLRVGDGGDDLSWTAVSEDRVSPVLNSSVTVRLPPALVGQVLATDASGDTDVQTPDESTVQFRAFSERAPGEELKAEISFTHGILPLEKPGWQLDEESINRNRLYIALGSTLAAAVMFALAARLYRPLGARYLVAVTLYMLAYFPVLAAVASWYTIAGFPEAAGAPIGAAIFLGGWLSSPLLFFVLRRRSSLSGS